MTTPVAAPHAGNEGEIRRRALISTSSKDGVAEFARELTGRGFEIVASGGTARALRSAGIPVLGVSEVTGHPEMLDGRVKTLHPAIHGGILARRGHPEDLAALDTQGIRPIDVVAVNFYPFEAALAEGAAESDLLEEVDIGGPCLVRAAAKNWPGVVVATDPGDYPAALRALDEANPDAARRLRRQLAGRAFARTAAYEQAISGWISGESPAASTDAFPSTLRLEFDRLAELRYGENPRQAAALYSSAHETGGIPEARQLHGKALSYNNLLDVDAALRLAADLEGLDAASDGVAAVVIKHSNPAGAAIAATARDAWRAARATDPVSAFGGVVALNGEVDLPAAKSLAAVFLEIIAAPGFTPKALRRLRRKKNLRLLEIPDGSAYRGGGPRLAQVTGGLLLQDRDLFEDQAGRGIPTRRQPTAEEWEGLRFAWRVAKHVKSNAIVAARGSALLGVGAGQMSRLDSCRLAVEKAQVPLEGAVAASDAFFPFADGLEALADAGIAAVIQPGGSVRDAEVVAAADARNLAMVFTGARHFRH